MRKAINILVEIISGVLGLFIAGIIFYGVIFIIGFILMSTLTGGLL